MKPSDPTVDVPGCLKTVTIPEEIAAKCDGPDQFQRFDSLFRAVIATPKADIDKADAKWKRKQEKKRAQKSS